MPFRFAGVNAAGRQFLRSRHQPAEQKRRSASEPNEHP